MPDDLIGIESKFSKSATPDLRKALAVPMAIARATAAHIRRRVLGGKTASPPQPYFGPRAPIRDKRSGRLRKRFYYISPAYAEKLGLKGQTRWASSAEFHRFAGVKPGTAHVTGGMWKGLQVRNFGRQGALIEFARSSLGSSSVRTAITRKVEGTFELTRNARGKLRARQVREDVRDEGGNVKLRRKPKKVRNSEKAGRVFKSTRVGLLQPTLAETRAQLAAVAETAKGAVMVSFGADQVDGEVIAGDKRLFAAIRREIGRQ